MALAVTSVANGKGNTTGFTTASVSVSAGDLMVMFICCDATPVISAFSGLGATWTVQFNTAPTNLNYIMYTGTVPSGTSGTVTVGWTGSRNFIYELLKCSGTSVNMIRASALSWTSGVSSPNALGVALSSPPTGYAIVGSWGVKFNAGTFSSWTTDAGEATWTRGVATQTQGTIALTTQWATTGDSVPTGTYAWSASTADVSAAAIMISEARPAALGAALVPRVTNLYTIGLGGYQPTRMLRAGGFDMGAGANIPNASGGPTLYPTGRDDVLGNPATPSLKLRGVGEFGPFYWPVSVGTRTVTCKVYYTPDDGAAYRPQLIVKASSQLGVQSNQVATAPAGADAWQDMPTLTIPISAAGVLEIVLKTRNSRPDGAGPVGSGSPQVFCSWDHIVVS